MIPRLPSRPLLYPLLWMLALDFITVPPTLSQDVTIPLAARTELLVEDLGGIARAIIDQSGDLYVLTHAGILRGISVDGELGPSLPVGSTGLRLGLVGDTIWVADVRSGQVTLYDSRLAGGTTRNVRYRSRDPRLQSVGPSYLLRNGNVLVTPTPTLEVIRRTPNVSSPVLFWHTHDTQVDTVFTMNMAHGLLLVDARSVAVYSPFLDDPLIEVHPTGDGFVRVYRSSTHSGAPGAVRVHYFDWAGAPRGEYTVQLPPVKISVEAVEDAVDEAFGRFYTGRTDSVAFRANVEQGLYIPEYVPVVKELVVSTDWSVLLHTGSVSSNARWLWIRPDGRRRGIVELPDRVKVLGVAGDLMWVSDETPPARLRLYEAQGR